MIAMALLSNEILTGILVRSIVQGKQFINCLSHCTKLQTIFLKVHLAFKNLPW